VRIRVEPHTLRQAEKRGITSQEIEEVILTGSPMPAKYGRLAKFKAFQLSRPWKGQRYKQKRVEVVYVVEKGVNTTVAVYAFYGRW
jgi:hypothetical protein